MTIEAGMKELVAALPAKSRQLRHETIREAALFLLESGTWQVLAGGHHAVSLGEWGGDFDGVGATPEDAIAACLSAIRAV